MFQANGILQGVQEVHQEMMKVLDNRRGGSVLDRNASNDANDDAEVTTGVGPSHKQYFYGRGCSIVSHEGFKFRQ